MTRRMLALFAGSFVLSTHVAHAQAVDTVPEPRDAAKLALVRELMTTANFRQQLVRTMRETSTRQGAMAPVPPGFWDKFLARAEQDADTLLAPMVDDYARYFTTADLRALITFYQSNAGKRFRLVAPVISANASFVGMKWGQRVGAEVAGELMRDTALPKPTPESKATKKP
jgi:hypothetical protein